MNWMTGRGSKVALYSIFSCSFLWKHTGRMETTARTASTASEYQDTASPAVVSLYSVVPAFMATKDGGATPEREMREHTEKRILPEMLSICISRALAKSAGWSDPVCAQNAAAITVKSAPV